MLVGPIVLRSDISGNPSQMKQVPTPDYKRNGESLVNLPTNQSQSPATDFDQPQQKYGLIVIVASEAVCFFPQPVDNPQEGFVSILHDELFKPLQPEVDRLEATYGL
jgi:hypothetical protein